MLKLQYEVQKSREYARAYLAATGFTGTPEEYLVSLKAYENHFLDLINGRLHAREEKPRRRSNT